MIRIALGVALLLVLSCAPAPPPITSHASAPKLLVVISVDQMRADYIDQFQHQWTKGLRRLVEQGAWFQQAAYPYLNTVTCPGHATIATGAVPAVHGMIQNEWWDRDAQRMIVCTDDSSASPVSYGLPVRRGHSAERLQAPTLADRMRAALRIAPRVVTMSLKARAAIMLAGRRGDAVTWFDEGAGTWATSSAFTNAPVPFLTRFIGEHPISADLGKTWSRTLPRDRYLYDDLSAGKLPTGSWGPSLPHELGRSGTLDGEFFEEWQGSPYSDSYLAQMAVTSVEALSLGTGPGTDYLGISFSALDHAGHDFGPMSHEVQDVLMRLDQTLGVLLDALDQQVGAGRYALALSADHGVSPIPEQMVALGEDAGRIDHKALTSRVERLLSGRYGPGQYVSLLDHTDLYFAPGAYDKISGDEHTLEELTKLIESQPGVWRVFRGDELAKRAGPGDHLAATAASLSYFPGRSGDLILVPRLHWIAADDSAATHGTLHAYDARVPIILMGAGFRAGRYQQAASPADIAPTLASLVGVDMPRSSGRVLREAMKTVRGSTVQGSAVRRTVVP